MKNLITLLFLCLSLSAFPCHRKQIPVPKLDIMKWLPSEREDVISVDILTYPIPDPGLDESIYEGMFEDATETTISKECFLELKNLKKQQTIKKFVLPLLSNQIILFPPFKVNR